MVVRFDKLNRFETPKFILCNPGSTYTNGLTTYTVGVLADTSDEEIIFNFNDTSELRMRVNRVGYENQNDNAYANRLFRGIQNRRLIFVDDIGYFVISSVQDGYDGEKEYKDLIAQSCDIEIKKKSLTYIPDGTYKFDDLLELIVSTLPKWVIGYVDSSVSLKYRTFEDVDVTKDTLTFFLDDMQTAYECIFIFDIVNRKINIYDQNNYVVQTNIHITKDDLIKSLQVVEKADDLVTALTVLGDNDLTISAINPIGTSTLYNFSYYLDWMSSGLRSKVVSWMDLQESVLDSYYEMNLNYYNLLSERANKIADREKEKVVLDMYMKCRDNIVSTSNYTRLDEYNEVIEENGGTLIEIQYDIEATVAKIDEQIGLVEEGLLVINGEIEELDLLIQVQLEEIKEIHNSVDIDSYFTSEEYDELYDYIYPGSYSDSYVIITDNMTYEEKFQQMKILYDRAKSQLEKVAEPTQEFSVDVESFVFSKEFEPWSNQLETGCLINVELDENDVAALFLTDITINYEEKALAFTFGNRYNKFGSKALFNKVLGNISKTTNAVENIKDTIYPIKNGELDAMQESLAQSRSLTMNAAMTSKNEEVIIDGSGYTGRQVLDDGTYDPRQVKLTGCTLVFTDDAWKTCKTALGQLILANGETTYGLNAATIIGDLIIGNQLQIYDSDGKELLSAMNNKIALAVKNSEDKLQTQIKQNADSISIKAESEEGTLETVIATDGTWKTSYIDKETNVELSGLLFDFTRKRFIFNGAGNFSGSLDIGNGSFIVDEDGEVTTYGSVKILKNSDASRYSGFYAYGGDNEATSNYTTMESNGMSVYTYDGIRRAKLGFPSGHPESPYMILNGGTVDNAAQVIMKQFTDGVWIGSAAVMDLYGAFTPIEGCNGFFISLLDETVYVVSGTEMQNVYLGEAVAKFG